MTPNYAHAIRTHDRQGVNSKRSASGAPQQKETPTAATPRSARRSSDRRPLQRRGSLHRSLRSLELRNKSSTTPRRNSADIKRAIVDPPRARHTNSTSASLRFALDLGTSPRTRNALACARETNSNYAMQKGGS